MEVMDYEKKYNNALEYAKECLKDGGISHKSIKYIESIFPELKESEDEKIRKEMIAYMKHPHNNELYPKVWISWLEKQGEQKCTAEEVLIKAGLKPYKDGDQWCILLGDNIQEGICGFGDTIDDALYAFLNDLIKSQKEQKPAEWSEEDKNTIVKMRDFFIGVLGDRPDFTKDKRYEEFIEFIDNRLKSLRPHSQWKPSDEHYELEKFAKIVRGNLTGISKAVQKLFEAKYLQLTGNKMYGGFKD